MKKIKDWSEMVVTGSAGVAPLPQYPSLEPVRSLCGCPMCEYHVSAAKIEKEQHK